MKVFIHWLEIILLEKRSFIEMLQIEDNGFYFPHLESH